MKMKKLFGVLVVSGAALALASSCGAGTNGSQGSAVTTTADGGTDGGTGTTPSGAHQSW